MKFKKKYRYDSMTVEQLAELMRQRNRIHMCGTRVRKRYCVVCKDAVVEGNRYYVADHGSQYLAHVKCADDVITSSAEKARKMREFTVPRVEEEEDDSLPPKYTDNSFAPVVDDCEELETHPNFLRTAARHPLGVPVSDSAILIEGQTKFEKMPMKEAAIRLNVSERTLRRWVADGKVQVETTLAGHRLVTVPEYTEDEAVNDKLAEKDAQILELAKELAYTQGRQDALKEFTAWALKIVEGKLAPSATVAPQFDFEGSFGGKTK